MKDNITIFRKRHIPDEIVKLKDDIILKCDNDVIVTEWKCIRPRIDIDRGISAYFIKKGYKISKMYNANNEIVQWYCDIMTMREGQTPQELIYEDMLLDVIVYPDGHVEVVDADEFAEAMEKNMISKEDAVAALRSMNELLGIIYSKKFEELTKHIDEVDEV